MNEVRFLDPPSLPRPLAGPPVGGRALVVAPHPDDEIIGPGGTVLKHRAQGDSVLFVILTDGTQGDPDGEGNPATYHARREAESRQVAREVGAQVRFCGFPDGARAREEDLGAVVPELVQILHEFLPDVIYAPHEGEAHGDHHVAALAVRRALHECGRAIPCFGYEIWSPLVADVVVDISEQQEEKQRLVNLFVSQVMHTDISHHFLGLNAYRAVFLPKGARYGEAFCHMDPWAPS